MIKNITQPEVIHIHDSLRLRKFDDNYSCALPWYQDLNTLKLVDGMDATVYDLEKLKRMYNYLNNQGELYFIEVLEGNAFTPIGDVTFWQHDMPIVIGDSRYRNCGIGQQVVQALILRGKELGFDSLYINEIYDFNVGSRALFEKNGFIAYKKTENGASFRLILETVSK